MALFRRRPTSAEVHVYSGSEWLEVKGESAFQPNLEAIAGPKCHDGYNLPVDAVLIREPDNPHDANAIAVYATDPRTGRASKVGFVGRPAVERLAPAIDRKNAAGETVGMEGYIRGGWLRSDGDEGHYGIWLSYDPADFGL